MNVDVCKTYRLENDGRFVLKHVTEPLQNKLLGSYADSPNSHLNPHDDGSEELLTIIEDMKTVKDSGLTREDIEEVKILMLEVMSTDAF